MNNFQNTVLTIAIVLLIICLIIIAIIIYREKYITPYPPVVADCPDYWLDTVSKDKDGSVCTNVKNLGLESTPYTMDFTAPGWQGDSGACNKYKWSKQNNITWDGITNDPFLCTPPGQENNVTLTNAANNTP